MKKQFRNTQEPKKKKKSVIQKPKVGKIQSVPETRQVDSNQVDQTSQRNALGDQEYPKPGRQEPSEQKEVRALPLQDVWTAEVKHPGKEVYKENLILRQTCPAWDCQEK